MPRRALSLALLASLAAAPAKAQDICAYVLTQQAFDVEDSTLTTSIAQSSRASLCSRSYASLSEARSAASESGFSGGYHGISIEAEHATKSSEGRTRIDDTSFCRASAGELESAMGASYHRQVASVAVAAWEQCVSTTQANRLYLEYSLHEEGRMFTGILHKTSAAGPLQSRITGIVAEGEGAAGVRCNIGGESFTPEEIAGNPYALTVTKTAVTCRKTDDAHVSISLQTSADALPFVHMPSPEAREEGRLDRIEQEMNALAASLHGSVLISERPCADLGAGWRPYEAGAGRFLLGAGEAYAAGSEGGAAQVALTGAQTPRHAHRYWDTFHSEHSSHRRGQSTNANPRRIGSQGGTDTDNVGFQKRRRTDEWGGAEAHENMPPYRAVHFCARG